MQKCYKWVSLQVDARQHNDIITSGIDENLQGYKIHLAASFSCPTPELYPSCRVRSPLCLPLSSSVFIPRIPVFSSHSVC